MKFEVIRRRVERSEQLVEGRALQTGVRAHALKTTWRESWTPTRIILAGLAAGFLTGRAEPTHVLKQLGGSGRWIQLVGALSGLFASLQSSVAAASADKAVDHADKAVDHADEAVDHADEAADQASEAADAAHVAAGDTVAAGDDPDPTQPLPRSDRRRPDPSWDVPPSPAEAATEISER